VETVWNDGTILGLKYETTRNRRCNPNLYSVSLSLDFDNFSQMLLLFFLCN
jgi:hypothetical protein